MATIQFTATDDLTRVNALLDTAATLAGVVLDSVQLAATSALLHGEPVHVNGVLTITADGDQITLDLAL